MRKNMEESGRDVVKLSNSYTFVRVWRLWLDVGRRRLYYGLHDHVAAGFCWLEKFSWLVDSYMYRWTIASAKFRFFFFLRVNKRNIGTLINTRIQNDVVVSYLDARKNLIMRKKRPSLGQALSTKRRTNWKLSFSNRISLLKFYSKKWSP